VNGLVPGGFPLGWQKRNRDREINLVGGETRGLGSGATERNSREKLIEGKKRLYRNQELAGVGMPDQLDLETAGNDGVSLSKWSELQFGSQWFLCKSKESLRKNESTARKSRILRANGLKRKSRGGS